MICMRVHCGKKPPKNELYCDSCYDHISNSKCKCGQRTILDCTRKCLSATEKASIIAMEDEELAYKWHGWYKLREARDSCPVC